MFSLSFVPDEQSSPTRLRESDDSSDSPRGPSPPPPLLRVPSPPRRHTQTKASKKTKLQQQKSQEQQRVVHDPAAPTVLEHDRTPQTRTFGMYIIKDFMTC